ncbi:MAG: hypothetical protein RLZZ342_266 [Candidatus Parcubacteria bacterium]|jgi:hypothetical protein
MRRLGTLSLAAFLLGTGVVYAAGTGFLPPIADGVHQDFTPVGSAQHFQNVDDALDCNGITDYNETFGINDRDSYFVDISGVPAGATITRVDIVPCASRASLLPGGAKMRVFAIVDGVQTPDAGSYSIGLSGSNVPVRLATTTVFTNAVKTATSTVQVGAVLTTNGGGLRLSGIRARVVFQ